VDQETLKVLKQLQDANVPLGQWQEMEEASVQTESLKDLQTMLATLRDLLQVQLDQGVKELDEAKQKLDRIQHGGGY